MTNKFKNKTYKNKIILAFVLLFLALFSTINIDRIIGAESSDSNYEQIESGISSVLNNMNFNEVDKLFENIDDLNYFDSDMKTKIQSILNGEYFTNYSSIFTAIVSIIFGDIKNLLPMVLTFIAIAILSSILSNMKNTGNKGTNDIIYFACFSVMVLVLLVSLRSILNTTYSTLNSINSQMQVMFPILITLLSTVGSLTTISIYNPLVAILSGSVSFVFSKFLYPIFILILLLTIIGNLTDTIKLDKFCGFLNSSFKWIVGIVFTVFAGFLTMQGISAGKFDSVSIKATKFAIKSYIPIIGGYISEGMDFIVLGSILIKNSVGLIGFMLLFLTILSPIINIVVYKLSLMLSAGIIEMTGNTKMANFLSSISKLLILPIVIILGIALMYVIMITLIICTANIL